jgi:hypothetical protein
MRNRTVLITTTIVILMALVFSACSADTEQDIAVIVALTQTAAASVDTPAAEPTAAPANGSISGSVGFHAPPTPPMTVYAVDTASGAYFSVDTPLTEGESSYTIDVPAGTYIIYAFSNEGAYTGYSKNGWDLATVTVTAGQNVTGIAVRVPGQSECGEMFGVPASPDGRFAAVPGPDADCAAMVQANPTGVDIYSAPTGIIAGTVSLFAPPTPALTIYAFDPATNLYYYTETAEIEGPAEYSLEVTQGSYYLIAYSAGGGIAAYAPDGRNFGLVDMSDNQTITGIDLHVPGMSENGPLFSIPPSPDGRFSGSQTGPVSMQGFDVERISFAAGATSGTVQGTLVSGLSNRYVLTVLAGQQMNVSISPQDAAILNIYGNDGYILVSGNTGTSVWSGTVPSTQDYLIELISTGSTNVDYSLTVSIPAGSSGSGQSATADGDPFAWPDLEKLALTGVPYMLPPEFPVEAGLPEIVPYFITRDADVYEISLDYGVECQGVGACHYGFLGAHLADGALPTGSSQYPFDSSRAQTVQLDRGITGYFMDAQCGANCGDAVVYWIYNGYEYMLGLKAGPKDIVVALANAAINNSIRE